MAAVWFNSRATADVKTFSPPVAKTRHALIFKIHGVDPATVGSASATVSRRGGAVAKKSLSVDRIRRAARARGKLKVPHAGSRARAASAAARPGNGTVTVVTGSDTTPPRRSSRLARRPRRPPPPCSSGRRQRRRGRRGYECSLDDPGWSACASPDYYSGLSVASHTFSVRAKDKAGNVDATPATATWTVKTESPVYNVPGSVPAGCSTDATSQILSWIATVPDNSTVRFASGACCRIEGTLQLRNRTLTIDDNGASFKSFDPPTDQRAMWRAWDSSRTFRNTTTFGSYANGGVHDETIEHGHGIDLRGTDSIVQSVTMSDLSGDRVYFGLGSDRSTGAVQDSSCKAIGRNAVSVTAGDGIRVERMTTDRIGYIAFDVEPNSGAGWGSSGVVFDSNTIGSYRMKDYTVIGNAPVADQYFTNNTIVNQGLKIGTINNSNGPERVTISGNRASAAVSPASMNLDGLDDVTVTGNTVPLTGGTMASLDNSCPINVSGNSYPGGSQEKSVTSPAC